MILMADHLLVLWFFLLTRFLCYDLEITQSISNKIYCWILCYLLSFLLFKQIVNYLCEKKKWLVKQQKICIDDNGFKLIFFCDLPLSVVFVVYMHKLVVGLVQYICMFVVLDILVSNLLLDMEHQQYRQRDQSLQVSVPPLLLPGPGDVLPDMRSLVLLLYFPVRNNNKKVILFIFKFYLCKKIHQITLNKKHQTNNKI